MMGWYGNGGWGGAMVFMGLFWVAVLAAVVWAVARWSRRADESAAAPVESARAILDRRFASGQIDAAEYGEARRVLEGRSVDDTRR